MRRPGRTSFQDCDKLEATFVKSVHIREPSNLRFTETAAFFAHFHQIIMTVANCRTITIPIDSNISRTRRIIIYTGSWEWILNNNKTSVCLVALKVRFFIQKKTHQGGGDEATLHTLILTEYQQWWTDRDHGDKLRCFHIDCEKASNENVRQKVQKRQNRADLGVSIWK